MRIEILYVRDCPNYVSTLDRLKAVLMQEGISAEVSAIEVTDESSARALMFLGSPTIRVNGLDIESDCRTATEWGLACRLYPGGLPSDEMIRAALRQAQER